MRSKLDQGVSSDRLVVRAVPGDAAFEEDEGVDLPRLAGKAPLALQEACELAGAAALPSRERDVRVKGAALGLEADVLADPLDLRRDGRDVGFGFNAGP